MENRAEGGIFGTQLHPGYQIVPVPLDVFLAASMITRVAQEVLSTASLASKSHNIQLGQYFETPGIPALPEGTLSPVSSSFRNWN